jgi:hypothetical protein
MAVNRMRNALGSGPRKGETFELRAGLVYDLNICFIMDSEADNLSGHSMLTKGRICSPAQVQNDSDI